jgi:tetratricopeptide (TPR) repeat protein
LACCQTCNSSTEDSGILAVFDLVAGVQISSFSAESGWANHYEFPPGEGIVRLGYPNDGGTFSYTLAGDFIEREEWLEAGLERGDLYLAKRMMEEAGNQPPPALAARLLASVDTGLRHQNWRDDRSQAFGWRLKGEILEASAELEEALRCYEKALALNPKIGIKRRVEQMKKAQSR